MMLPLPVRPIGVHGFVAGSDRRRPASFPPIAGRTQRARLVLMQVDRDCCYSVEAFVWRLMPFVVTTRTTLRGDGSAAFDRTGLADPFPRVRRRRSAARCSRASGARVAAVAAAVGR
jgi:hypothetical protein